MKGFKDLGLRVIKHTNGMILWPIMDMIVDSGIDCLDPMRPGRGHGPRRSEAEVRTPDRFEGKRRLLPLDDLRDSRASRNRDTPCAERWRTGRRFHPIIKQFDPFLSETRKLLIDAPNVEGIRDIPNPGLIEASKRVLKRPDIDACR